MQDGRVRGPSLGGRGGAQREWMRMSRWNDTRIERDVYDLFLLASFITTSIPAHSLSLS